MGVAHRNPVTRPGQHRHVVGHVAERHHVIGGDLQRTRHLLDAGGLADAQRHDLDQPVVGRVRDVAFDADVRGQRCGHVCAAGAGHPDQQLHGGRTQQIGERHLGVVGVQPGVLVAGRADELRGGRVVRAAAHPLDRQPGAGNRAGSDLGQHGQQVRGQRPGRHDAVGGRVVEHCAVGAHRHRGEAQRIDHRGDPPRRAPGGQHERRAGGDRGGNRVTRAHGDRLVGVEQSSVHIAGDQRGWVHLRAYASRWERSACFRARSTSSASSSSLASGGVGAPPPSRRGTQYWPAGLG